VAAAIAVAAWGIAVLATVLLVMSRPPVDEGLWFYLVDVTVAAVYGTVTGLTLSRRRHPVPWILAVTALGGALAAFGYGYRSLSESRGGLPLVDVIAPMQSIAWVPGTLALFLVVPWLVRDHRLTALPTAGLTAGVGVILWFLATNLLRPEAPPLAPLGAAVLVGLLAAAETEWRHRRGPVAERNGLGWLALGTTVLAVSFVPLLVPYGALPLPIWTTPALHLASQAVYPAAVLVAVLRGRMWGLGLVVSRTVVAALLTVGLLVIYLVATVLVSALLPGEGVAHLVGAGVVAVAVQPARLWLQQRVHRLVYGVAADTTQLVRRLGTQLGLDGSAEELLHGLAADIGAAMRLESVRVTAAGVSPVTWGEARSAPVDVPLRHRGEDVGTLEVTLPAGEALGARATRTLADLAAVVATAVTVVRVAAEVEESRARLARARLEERRLIRREIHDGLGPSLAGLRFGLQGARNLLASDPAGAAEVLTSLQAELDRQVTAVRTLSHHLLPPVLDELGLGAALEELAARHREDGLEVQVVTDLPEALEPGLAAAAYGIISEAVVNAARHSGARRCSVEVRLVGGDLSLIVVDDGCGIAPEAVPGVGTRAMRERAAERGGLLDVTARPGGGTEVRGVLPVVAVTHG
jgi:signal transduction histidine kinase